MLKKINKWIQIRNNNFKKFLSIQRKFHNEFLITNNKNISSFVLPFLMKNKLIKNKLENYLNRNGIETRPFIAGNLLRQPFLRDFKKKKLKNSDFIEFNSFYIGNNQFVNSARLNKLEKLLRNFF